MATNGQLNSETAMTPYDLVSDFNPLEPIPPDDPRYVDLDAVTGGRPVLKRLVRGTAAVAGRPRWSRQIVSGLPGTGKSTLLNRLQRAFDEQGRDALVLRRDVSDLVEITGLPTPAELLAIMIVELQASLAEVPGALSDAGVLVPALRALYDALRPDEVTVSLGPVSLRKSLDPQTGSLAARLRAFTESELREFLPKALADGARLVEELQRATGKKEVVLVLDGLEKGAPRGRVDREEDARYRARAHVLYQNWIPKFELPCHRILSAPAGLVVSGGLGTHYINIEFIGMAKVMDRDRQPYQAGELALAGLIHHRHSDATRLLFGGRDNPNILRVVRASGGFLRDVIRLVANAVFENVDDIVPVPDAIWERVLRTHEVEVRDRVPLDPFSLLRKFHADPQTEGEVRSLRGLTEDEQGMTWGLIDRGVLLGYQNGERWFDLHPAFHGDPRLAPDFERRVATDQRPLDESGA